MLFKSITEFPTTLKQDSFLTFKVLNALLEIFLLLTLMAHLVKLLDENFYI